MEEPSLAGQKLSKLPLAYLLYGMLTLAAAAALLAGTRADLVPASMRLAAPLAFGGFLLLFAAYRFALVRAGRYPAGKAFFQGGAGALFLTLLLSGSLHAPVDAEVLRPLESLLADSDPSVRALACEVTRHRADGRRHAVALAERLADPVAEVRAQARSSLASIAGMDFGEGPEAAERWRAWATSSLQAP